MQFQTSKFEVFATSNSNIIEELKLEYIDNLPHHSLLPPGLKISSWAEATVKKAATAARVTGRGAIMAFEGDERKFRKSGGRG